MKIRDKVLIVEDEQNIKNFMSTILAANGFDTLMAGSAKEALSMISSHCPDLIILDLGLPDMDGMEVLKQVRAWSSVPVIVVSARTHERDKVEALDLGADDYVTKPFDPIEVQARVRSQLRRYTRLGGQQKREQPKDTITIGGVELNDAEKSVTVDGEPVQLTPIEFSILWYLCENQGRVVSSEELFEAVWGEKFLDNNNTVMAHIGRLREKLCEPPRKPRFIKTVWGVGYQIE